MKLLGFSNAYWLEAPTEYLELARLVESSPFGYVLKLNGSFSGLKAWVVRTTAKHGASTEDLATRVYWILNGLEEAPRCANPECGAKISKSFSVLAKKNPKYCSVKCANICRERLAHVAVSRKTHASEDLGYWQKIEMKRKAYRVAHGLPANWNNSVKAVVTKNAKRAEDPSYYAKIEAKKKATKIRCGRAANWHNVEQAVATRRLKNGGSWETLDIKAKRETSCLRKYGFAYSNSAPSVKAKLKLTCLAKYGVDSYSKTPAYREQMLAADERRKAKERETKRRHGTFNSSTAEERVYAFLAGKFGESGVVRQYSSREYPFSCDFYVKPLCLYIECNFSWTHGGHWFDANNEADQLKLAKWKSRGSKFYLNAIKTWTERDVKKKKAIAEGNKLRYFALWEEDYAALEAALTSFGA